MTRIFTALQNTEGSPGEFYGFAEGFMAMERLNLAKQSQAHKELVDMIALGVDSGSEYDANIDEWEGTPEDTGTPTDHVPETGTSTQPFTVPTAPGGHDSGAADTPEPFKSLDISVDGSGISPDPALKEAVGAPGLGLIFAPVGYAGRLLNKLIGNPLMGAMDVAEAPAEKPKSWTTKVPDSAGDPKPNITGSKKAAKPETVAQEEFAAGEAARQEEERLRLEAEAKKAVGNYGGND